MDARTLDVREAGIDAAEDQFFTNRANMDMADRVISIVALVFAVRAFARCSRTYCLSSACR